MCFTKSSQRKKKLDHKKLKDIFLQNLRVEIDAQGNLQRISNSKKGLDIAFSNQGLYWYQSTFIIINIIVDSSLS
jgi:hypothetical protein